jgi:hypothetical protein
MTEQIIKSEIKKLKKKLTINKNIDAIIENSEKIDNKKYDINSIQVNYSDKLNFLLADINEFIGNGLVPCTFISPSLEGGHQDHDAAYIIAQSLSRTWSAEHFSFPLYSSSRFPYPFFRTMKRAEGFTAFPQTLKTRWYFVKTAIKLIKIYRSQKSTWIGLTLPLLVHYAFTSPVYYINQKRRVESIDNFLYESRRLETRKVLELFEKSFSTYN